MIDDNEYLDLPDDPEEAFAILHRRKFKQVKEAWNDSNNGGYIEQEYIDNMIAFDEVHALGILKDFKKVPTRTQEFNDFFQDFRRYCEIASQKILMEQARRAKSSATALVIFDANTKKAIHLLIQSIREKLNELKLPEDKREALFKKLAAFVVELDNNRTHAQAFYAFAFDLTKAGREIAEEIAPVLDVVDRISDLIDKAKKLKDVFPPWGERKKIEGPAKQIEGPKPSGGSHLDDDIPF